MASHFSCIGFPVHDMTAYWALARRAAKEGTHIRAPDGTALARWAVGSGPEIWAQIDQDGEVIGATPFFSTGVGYRIAVTGTGEAPGEPMDGWIDGWLEPVEEDEPYSGVFPLRVDLIDYVVVRSQLRTFPVLHQVELVALAHEADLYPDNAAYTSAFGDVYRLPIQSFVSAAHFGVDDPTGIEEATAIASGHISEVRQVTNGATEAAFWWIRLATQGVTLHVFVDRETLASEPHGGQIFAGSFWLLGRLQ